MAAPATPVRVGLEVGRRWVFATALDWPGLCRRGKGEQAALETLLAYADRYAAAVEAGWAPGRLSVTGLSVVGRVPGNATTEFGAPGVPGPWDAEPLDAAGADRLAGLVQACWQAFDAVVAGAPEQLRKGPRGRGAAGPRGRGRDRDPIGEHVREAERSYGRQLGIRLAPGTPWPKQREALAGRMRARPAGTPWTVRYAATRIAWHVLDHAWEIEDKS